MIYEQYYNTLRTLRLNKLFLTVFFPVRETYSLDSQWQTNDVYEMVFKDRLKAR